DMGRTKRLTYSYLVSRSDVGASALMSTEASATPTAPATVPGAPRNLQAIPGDAQVTLNWQAPSNDGGSPILLYTIYRGMSSGEEILMVHVCLVVTYTDRIVSNALKN